MHAESSFPLRGHFPALNRRFPAQWSTVLLIIKQDIFVIDDAAALAADCGRVC
jgi:hypothetical protein